MSDILVNKLTTIERCLERIREDYDGEFRSNFTKQDAIVLNIERACQACMDMAAHAVRVRRLGPPQHSRDLFTLLEENGLLPSDLADPLRAMVGFRNIAVHNYRALNLDVVERIIAVHLEDFLAFGRLMVAEGE